MQEESVKGTTGQSPTGVRTEQLHLLVVLTREVLHAQADELTVILGVTIVVHLVQLQVMLNDVLLVALEVFLQ